MSQPWTARWRKVERDLRARFRSACVQPKAEAGAEHPLHRCGDDAHAGVRASRIVREQHQNPHRRRTVAESDLV